MIMAVRILRKLRPKNFELSKILGSPRSGAGPNGEICRGAWQTRCYQVGSKDITLTTPSAIRRQNNKVYKSARPSLNNDWRFLDESDRANEHGDDGVQGGSMTGNEEEDSETDRFSDLGEKPDYQAWLAEFVDTKKALTDDEWRDVQATVRQNGWFRTGHFESQLMYACSMRRNFSLGRSLMMYLENNGIMPTVVTKSKYLRLAGDCSEETTEKMVLDLYEKFIGQYKLLDSRTCEDVIVGISATSRWKEGIEYLKMMELTCNRPSQLAMVQLSLAAFRNRDHELGWELLRDCALHFPSTHMETPLLKWMGICKTAAPEEQKLLLDQMLRFLGEHEIYISREVAEHVKFLFESQTSSDWTATFTQISASGKCLACRTRLEPVALTGEEFSLLRDSFLDRVVTGKDIFLKSNPNELKRFIQFVKYTAPYDIVIDGLNVAFAVRRDHPNNLLAAAQRIWNVVQHFKEQGKKVLVLGRQHMKSWPKHVMDLIKRESVVFFAENISKDDPFMLYAAMYSGQETLFMSRDMMRDHLYNLHNQQLASYFRKWQRGHQVELLDIKKTGHVHCKLPLVYDPVAQGIAQDHWHMPIIEGKSRMPSVISNDWLCLKLNAGMPKLGISADLLLGQNRKLLK